MERGQPDQALQMFKESLQIQRDAGDETYQALCLNNIGTAYLQKGENEDALTYLAAGVADPREVERAGRYCRDAAQSGRGLCQARTV